MSTVEVAPERLRDYRLAAGYTLEELSLLVALSPSALSRAERGLIHLPPEARVRVMRALRLNSRTARRIGELAP